MEIEDIRWAIYIDIERFSHYWEQDKKKARHSLTCMMRAIYKIGTRICTDDKNRLFAHHIGDGFFIISEFREIDLERAITIAVALMRYVSQSGLFTKAAIVEGDNADIRDCYPKEIRARLGGDGDSFSLGAGVMTIFTVMGTALIRAYKLAEESPPGPMLTIGASMRERIPGHIIFRQEEGEYNNLLMIDWVHMESKLLNNIQHEADLLIPSPEEVEEKLVQYCNKLKKSENLKCWIENVKRFLNIPVVMEDC